MSGADAGPRDNTVGRASRVQKQLDRDRLRRLAIRVLIVQVFALAALWLLQSHFGAS